MSPPYWKDNAQSHLGETSEMRSILIDTCIEVLNVTSPILQLSIRETFTFRVFR